MVVRAPAWIDPKMVITPRGAAEEMEPGEASDTDLPELDPRFKPDYHVVPIPEGWPPGARMPRYKLVPVPKRSSPPAKEKSPSP
jgi:hypothetical protein